MCILMECMDAQTRPYTLSSGPLCDNTVSQRVTGRGNLLGSVKIPAHSNDVDH